MGTLPFIILFIRHTLFNQFSFYMGTLHFLFLPIRTLFFITFSYINRLSSYHQNYFHAKHTPPWGNKTWRKRPTEATNPIKELLLPLIISIIIISIIIITIIVIVQAKHQAKSSELGQWDILADSKSTSRAQVISLFPLIHIGAEWWDKLLNAVNAGVIWGCRKLSQFWVPVGLLLWWKPAYK